MSIIKDSSAFLGRLDIYQILSLPVLIIILLFSFDFKSSEHKIGVVLPLTGEYRSRAQNHLNGLNLALKHINQHGGINNKKLVLLVRDCGEAQEKSAETTRDLIYDNAVTAIIGGFTPSNTRAIQAVAEKSETPFLTGVRTHFEVTDSGSAYTFRTITDDKRQFEALAEYSSKRFEISKLAIIYDEDLYGAESAQKYAEIAIKYGQEVVLAIPSKKTSLNFKKQLESILMSKPDALVVLSSSFDSALLVRQAREARFEKPILGGNQFASLEFINFLGIYSESILTTLPYNNRAGGQKSDYFSGEYVEKYGTSPDADAAMGYETLMVTALALKSVEGNNRNLKESLALTHGWESIAGSGGFDGEGNQVRPAEIAIIKDKQLIPVNMEGLF